MYEYKAQVVRVVDGDTVDVIIDLGFGVLLKERLRLNGIDAPERRKPTYDAGVASTDWLRSELPSDIMIRTYKNDKYGRIVADLIVEEENINQKMVKVGHAIYRDDWNAGSWLDPLGDE